MSTLRRLRRGVAKYRMKKAGCVQICKGKNSFFSNHWRDEYKK